MKVYSLVGKSGTGKSYRAGGLCSRYGIDGIIDDGLFIIGGRILAGISAKRQGTKYRAIKTALFTDDSHMRSVAERIRAAAPSAILVIGTSDRMVEIIVDRLGLPKPDTRFDIEDITTPDERDIAYRQRHELGKHVIPAPTFQIKKDFSGYFYHPIRTLLGMADARARERHSDAISGGSGATCDGDGALWDHSVVRPTYSYLGEFTISDRVVRDIVRSVAGGIDGISETSLILVHPHKEGAVVEVGIAVRYGWQIVEAAHRLQAMATAGIESMTSINVIAIDVEIQRLV
ncbi:MAG: Asp23/Gls24 family envelope stress response protein [Clostridiales Family XIII bacterium]|jgi:uncharacterized alkaline shock family protein YloU|nr:Asp23/Gls24 family envelope stress response protein [Clostridiales Family XIII bacterium]